MVNGVRSTFDSVRVYRFDILGLFCFHILNIQSPGLHIRRLLKGAIFFEQERPQRTAPSKILMEIKELYR